MIIRIDTENDAFKPDPGPEIYRILLALSARVHKGAVRGILTDLNGNKIGDFEP